MRRSNKTGNGLFGVQFDPFIHQENRSLLNNWVQYATVFAHQSSIERLTNRLCRTIPKASFANLFVKARYHIRLRKRERLKGFGTAQDANEVG
jgi:hypothetical protein